MVEAIQTQAILANLKSFGLQECQTNLPPTGPTRHNGVYLRQDQEEYVQTSEFSVLPFKPMEIHPDKHCGDFQVIGDQHQGYICDMCWQDKQKRELFRQALEQTNTREFIDKISVSTNESYLQVRTPELQDSLDMQSNTETAINKVNKMVISPEQTGRETRVVQGTITLGIINGTYFILRPRLPPEEMRFVNEKGYRAQIEFIDSNTRQVVDRKNAYYRYACMNPFKGALDIDWDEINVDFKTEKEFDEDEIKKLGDRGAELFKQDYSIQNKTEIMNILNQIEKLKKKTYR